MIKKIFLPLILLFFFLILISQSQAQESFEKYIIVFKPNVTKSQKYQMINQSGLVWGKDLNLINAQAVKIPKSSVNVLNKNPIILRIDPDAQVQVLDDIPALTRPPIIKAESICDWFPTWPGCSPKSSPSPTPKATPSPTPQISPKPSLNPSPTSSLSPTPVASPTINPSPVISPNPTPTGNQIIPWGISKINAPIAWQITQGDNVKIAVIDTGINRTHPDLIDNLAGCVNFINSNISCEDDNGHGTHVSGIIAAENNNLGVVGVAPKSKIYALKALNSQGSGYLSDIIEALDWSVTNHIQVINMSLGTSSNIQSLHDALIRVFNAGITQVAAAGNSGSGTNTVNYPAKYPEVIAVSALDSSNSVPYWSSRGTEVDLAAPGVNINSTYPNSSYQQMSGTSMSAPHVTGVVGLRLALHQNEKPTDIENVLENNTDSLAWDKTWVGYGLVDANKVVQAN